MKNLNEMLDQIQESKDWSRQIADRVLKARREKHRRTVVTTLTLAVSFIVIGGAVSLQQKAREESFKYAYNSALEEVLPQYDSSTIAVSDIEQKITVSGGK